MNADRVQRDAQLVVRAQLGDRRALSELVGHWHLPLWRYVRRMTADADDITQQAWATALGSLPHLREPDRFAPWLFTIARRRLMDQLRQAYGVPEHPDPAVPEGRDPLDGVLDRAQIAEGLDGLAPPEREVIELFHLQELSLQECSQVLAVPPGTVKSRLHRARRQLRDVLIAKGYAS
ncbi:RNA polymerase sigma factor [Actinoplanes sp. OR16]|uniref:RNA polymerase sigma factor n=1 Tax=Actinoplanes sp. OR16 TaxID=946334 RepID=UPI000F6B38C3|nr:sigma-70 family RNA polymerase sigma factor [Actinoplanes sp. OR16]BBH69531.1 RNA polymerase sigma factor [Actinoplanes sp. OR16]